MRARSIAASAAHYILILAALAVPVVSIAFGGWPDLKGWPELLSGWPVWLTLFVCQLAMLTGPVHILGRGRSFSTQQDGGALIPLPRHTKWIPLTRAAPSTSGRAQNRILISSYKSGFGGMGFLVVLALGQS
jgi:hypothetical protein